MSGMVLVYLVFLQTADIESKTEIIDKAAPEKVDEYVHLFERLILLLEFLQQQRAPKISIGRLHIYMPLLFEYLINTIERTKGAGNNIRKFHYNLHIAWDFIRLGMVNNFLETVGERNFKIHKGNARRTQRRQHTVDFQCAVRDVEGKVLERAYAEIMHEKTGEWHFFLG